MLKLDRRHHKIVAALVIVGGIAWAVWTFYLLPLSENPAIPKVETPASKSIDTN